MLKLEDRQEAISKGARTMKMFVIVYVDYLDESVTDELKQAGYRSYMKFHGLTGEDEKYEARTGTPGAPGKIKAVFMHVPDERVPHLLG